MLAPPATKKQTIVQPGEKTMGWNDCPYMFVSRSKSTRRRHVRCSSSISLDTATVNELISEDKVVTPPINTPSPVLKSRKSSSSLSEDEKEKPIATEEEVSKLLNELFAKTNKLSERQFQYHKNKMNSKDVLSNEDNRTFLVNVLNSFNTKQSYSDVESQILEFMMGHAGISWCVSLKKILANVNF
ncbi:unnamed protein product [Ambrosiozyma monospora]|uniref:Unnamed protein product n=1 Tax=Ambrosiozyma monospora TaxID=43982 RepID=A0ACB5T9U4_AMBMO|nr:unnamed protein product [Ambrosiozyma monospora]